MSWFQIGNGVKTKAQLTIPAVGKGPFPAVLLISGYGAIDMNYTVKNFKLFWTVANYLSERGFATFRYDKRGVCKFYYFGQNLWGNTQVNDLIHDAERALNVLTQHPKVDPKSISIIGHNEGIVITPREN